MGLLSHVYEGEYTFDPPHSYDEIKSHVESFVANNKIYSIPDSPEGMFERSGEKTHGVKNGYVNHDVQNEDKSIYLKRTSALFGFVDDIILTFQTDDDGNVTLMKIFSCSRVGMGDFYANKKGANAIMKGLPFKSVNLIRK